MKSIQSPIVLLRWLEDGLHHCSYQSWKPKHSWCQSKFDKCVWGALLQPVCHHDCDKHSTIWIEASCFPFVSVICSHFLNLPMKYRAWKMWKNVFYIPKHLICQLFHPSTSVNFLWCHCFHSTTMVIKHLYKKKKEKKSTRNFSPARSPYQSQWVQIETFSWQRAAILCPAGTIVWNLTVDTTRDCLWSRRASCNGTVVMR